jgi:DNA-binding NarL/FixJ family response regulator
MTSVLIADDQQLQRLAFRVLLESEPGLTVSGEAGHGAEAVRMAADLRPDVVVMDVQLPGLDGIEATRRIAATGGRTRVLIAPTSTSTSTPTPRWRPAPPASWSRTRCRASSSPRSTRWRPGRRPSRPG